MNNLEGDSFGYNVLTLATVSRNHFPIDENPVCHREPTPENTFGGNDRTYWQRDSDETWQEVEDSLRGASPDIFRTTSFFEKRTNDSCADMNTWNKAFDKLRPPCTSFGKKSVRSEHKLTNNSCVDIMDIVASFKNELETNGVAAENCRNENFHDLRKLRSWKSDDFCENEMIEDSMAGSRYSVACEEAPIPISLLFR